MGRLGRLGLEPANRYKRQRAGELIHIDVKKLGRIVGGAGHRVTGIQRNRDLRRGLKLKLTAAQPGRATATLRAAGRVIAGQSRTLAAGRAAALTIRPARRQAARLRRARRLSLRVKHGAHVHGQRIRLRR